VNKQHIDLHEVPPYAFGLPYIQRTGQPIIEGL